MRPALISVLTQDKRTALPWLKLCVPAWASPGLPLTALPGFATPATPAICVCLFVRDYQSPFYTFFQHLPSSDMFLLLSLFPHLLLFSQRQSTEVQQTVTWRCSWRCLEGSGCWRGNWTLSALVWNWD